MKFYKLLLPVLIFTLAYCTSNKDKSLVNRQISRINDSTYQVITYYPNGAIMSKSFWLNGKQGLVYEKYSDTGELIKDGRRAVLQGKDTLSINQKAQFSVLLSDTTKNISVSICRYDSNFILSEENFIPVKNGVGLMQFTPTTPGLHGMTGLIRIKEDTMFTYSYPFNYKWFAK